MIILNHISKRYKTRKRSDSDEANPDVEVEVEAEADTDTVTETDTDTESVSGPSSQERIRSRLKRYGFFAPKKPIQIIPALDDVSFRIESGEIFGILGPNGAGKTTLIKIIAGLLLPDSGTGTVEGYDIIRDREQVRHSINILRTGGWVIFDYRLSLYQNLRFWGSLMGLPLRFLDQRIHEVLKLVGLDGRSEDYPENLSAGLRQRLSLARCLLSDRPIYLLDEPTANVDPFNANFIREFIRNELAAKGKTVILATHNLHEAETLSDRILILNKGRIIALDTAKSLKKRIGNEIGFISLDPVLFTIWPDLHDVIKNDLMELPYVDYVTVDGGTIRIFGDMCNHLPELIDICREYGEVTKVDLWETSLEDVFLQLMKAG